MLVTKRTTAPAFPPIEVVIRVESPEELLALKVLALCNAADFKDSTDGQRVQGILDALNEALDMRFDDVRKLVDAAK